MESTGVINDRCQTNNGYKLRSHLRVSSLTFPIIYLPQQPMDILFRSRSRSSTPSSSPSPPSSWKPTALGVGGVANIFIKMRRARLQQKEYHIESSSGASQSHSSVAPEPESSKLGPFKNTDIFVCIGGVNATTLLRATRNTVVEEAEYWGANALVDEQ
jgi:hypothetical protein